MGRFGGRIQFDSLSAPGDLFWMCRVRETSAFFFMPASNGEVHGNPLIGFSISNCVLPSYMVTDQKASTGGNCPAGKVSVYLCLEPSRTSPSASVFAIG